MAKPKIDVGHVNPFIQATLDTLARMIGIVAVPGKIRPGKDSDIAHDISGIIGLAGDVKGMVCLSFPQDTALKIANKFMESDYQALDDEPAGAIGEIANIVAGAAKRDLKGLNIDISLPTVFQGGKLKIADSQAGLAFVVPFDSPMGRFDLLINLKSAA